MIPARDIMEFSVSSMEKELLNLLHVVEMVRSNDDNDAVMAIL